MVGNIELVLEPTTKRGIVATDTILKGGLILAPVAPIIQCTSVQIPDNALYLNYSVTLAVKSDDKGLTEAKFYVCPKYPQKFSEAKVSGTAAKATSEFIVSFWLLTLCGDSGKANCVIDSETVDCMGVDVNIPLLKNAKQLKKGDQMFVYQPHGTTTKWPIDSMLSSQPAKRQRTS